ncbi:MAG: hypothetical protein M1160_03545 [Candidatus Marsarchaeota archaeon]|jgi:hypothetical protein|nr:hypothetical protein [Candidatus Marsarchaeota archaeon]MCL5111918.1 hypothetical protein [Candidatus Marsarchaeota archaeon]
MGIKAMLTAIHSVPHRVRVPSPDMASLFTPDDGMQIRMRDTTLGTPLGT